MRALFLMVALLAALATPSRADDIATAQQVIQAQEQAFIRDDAAAAYSFAAPSIQSMFGNSDIFMLMVREGYPPVYRHRSFEFGKSKQSDGSIVQEVQIVDADGDPWLALYTLEPQADGSLKIVACTLSKLVGA